jgi:hypothetical protein
MASSSNIFAGVTIRPEPAPHRQVAFIDPNTKKEYLADHLIQFHVPELPKGKSSVKFPVYAPNGKQVDEITIGGEGGYRPGQMYLRPIDPSLKPLTAEEHQFDRMLEQMHKDDEFRRPLKKHHLDAELDERNERLAALGSLPTRVTLQTGKKDAPADFKRRKLLSEAQETLYFAQAALHGVLGHNKMPGFVDIEIARGRPAITQERQYTDEAIAMTMKRAQVLSIAEQLRRKVASLRQNLDKNQVYFRTVARLAKDWPLVANDRMRFNHVKGSDKLCVDCSNRLAGSIWTPSKRHDGNISLEDATRCKVFHSEAEDGNFTVRVQAPKICAFISIEITVGNMDSFVYCPRPDESGGGLVPGPTKRLLEMVRHSALCEEMFDFAREEAFQQLRNLDPSKKYLNVWKFCREEFEIQGLYLKDRVRVKMVPTNEESMDRHAAYVRKSPNALARCLCSVLASIVKGNWTSQKASAYQNRNGVIAYGAGAQFKGLASIVEYMNHVLLRNNLSTIWSNAKAATTFQWDTSIDEMTRDLIQRRSNNAFAKLPLCISVCNFSVPSFSFMGTIVIRKNYFVTVFVAHKDGTSASYECQSEEKVRHFLTERGIL